MPVVDYQAFIQDHFYIKTKKGELVPFIFNDVQKKFYHDLTTDYPDLQGVRENVLKSRQFGLSSIITGIFATDFILSEQGDIPITDSDIYSHTDAATADHIARFNLFLDSFLFKTQGGTALDIQANLDARDALRKAFLKVDNGGKIESRTRGAKYTTQTASARVSGRGGTKQNLHWSEVAFYPNTEIMNANLLVTGSEEQVPDQGGKIFRESTGNMMGDFYATEYYKGKDGTGDFHSRFYPWYDHAAYARPVPEAWQLPEYYNAVVQSGVATKEQCYWHYVKTEGLENKIRLRENPTYDYEAFLLSGSGFFDAQALVFHTNRIIKPLKEALYVQAL
jgi:hypothetical protein